MILLFFFVLLESIILQTLGNPRSGITSHWPNNISFLGDIGTLTKNRLKKTVPSFLYPEIIHQVSGDANIIGPDKQRILA